METTFTRLCAVVVVLVSARDWNILLYRERVKDCLVVW
jgi:hypothetical protein